VPVATLRSAAPGAFDASRVPGHVRCAHASFQRAGAGNPEGGNVLAVRQNNQWTVDAPPSAYAPITLRGYKMGQYLGKYMSSIEMEERVPIAQRWSVSAFAGVACLYGGGESCGDEANVYPNVGAGIQYILKQKEGIVVNLEYAQGKADNYAILLKLGWGF